MSERDIEQLRRAVLLQQLKRNGKVQSINKTSIFLSANRDHLIPLSFAQEGLWFIDTLEQGSAHYNIPLAFSLNGPMDQLALSVALNEIVQRHEILRTRFVIIDGKPYQQIQKDARLELVYLDLSTSPDRDYLAKQSAQKEAIRPFDLGYDLMIRATLLKLGDLHHVFLLTLHHIAADGWSIDLIKRELETLYSSHLHGKEAKLPKLTLQYADYASWQHAQEIPLQQQKKYWLKNLAYLPIVHNLPLDKPRPAILGTCGARISSTLNYVLTQKLRTQCAHQGATLFMGMHAALASLLSRYSGQTDIVISCPAANREYAELHPLVGLFVNTLILRSDLAGSPNFETVLKQSRERALQAYANQQVPFEHLVEMLQPPRSLSHSPLVQIMLAMDVDNSKDLQLPDLQIKQMNIEHSFAKFELMLNVSERHGDLSLEWNFNTDLFDYHTIAQMSRHFEQFVERALDEPWKPIDRLELLSETERSVQLIEWNNTYAPYPDDKCIQQLFEEQVRSTPDAVALIYNGQSVSYRTLNEKANRLARHLIKLGVGVDTLVGLCVQRSPQMIEGLLAILKAGGAYVPLDPDYPAPRLAFMLQDSGVQILLTQRNLKPQLPLHTVNHVISLDDKIDQGMWLKNEVYNIDPLSLSLGTRNLAYMIYTSGSSGKPKGVLIEHRGLCSLITGRIEGYAVGPGKIVLQFTSISFDTSTLEVFMTLCSGAALLVVEREAIMPVEPLIETLRIGGVTHAILPPAVLSMLPPDIKLPVLEMLAVGGDVCTGEAARQWSVGRQLFNAYGPTEVTVCVTHETITPTYPGTPAIGRPLANVRAYIFDEHMQLLPQGVVGEIYLGGVQVGRGYLNRADLTAERFVHDPFGKEHNARLYRTGDLARWRPNGVLEYLGRNDQQIKIRGFRIELGEIQSYLMQQPDVLEVIAIAREIRGDKQLLAYVVSNGQPSVDMSMRLRDQLRKTLPAYMVPAAVIVLKQFPLTSNGKIDRSALPLPEFDSSDSLPPDTDFGKAIAEAWKDVLELKTVPGRSANFFALGGHSLLAAKLIVTIQTRLDIKIPLRIIFITNTLQEFISSALIELGGINVNAGLCALTDPDQLIPLSFAQQRLWFIDKLEQGSAHYNIPLAFSLNGPMDQLALSVALNEIVQRHEILRTRFVIIDGQPYQQIQKDARLELVYLDLSTSPDKDYLVKRSVQKEAIRPFDLGYDLMIRATLLKLGNLHHVFLLTLHHIAGDGWSIGLIKRELETLYSSHLHGKEAKLPKLTLQYADYASWQHAQEIPLQQQKKYWLKNLAYLPIVHNLPLDKPRPAILGTCGARISSTLNYVLTQKLRTQCAHQGATLFMGMHAALASLLSRYSGQTDIVISCPAANREYAELHPLVGLFVNTLILRSDLAGSPNFETVLKQSRERALQAYANQQVPFEHLVEMLQPPRSLSHSPLVQIMLAMDVDNSKDLQLPDLQIKQMNIEHSFAKFELMLNVSERHGDLSLEWNFNTDLFDYHTIAQMSRHFEQFVERALDEPWKPIDRLELLSETERSVQLIEWNNTYAPYPDDKCIQQLFEEQVRSTPDAVALIYNGQSVSYRTLNEKANRLARHLIKLGVGVDTLVGLCVQRSPQMIEGLLAILKAGGAYVPLDPDYPAPRLAFMLQDSGVQILLTQRNLKPQLPLHTVNHVISLDDKIDQGMWLKNEVYNIDPLSLSLGTRNLAYMIYTSGSSGKPKGVLIEHRGLCSLITGRIEGYAVGPGKIVLQFTSISFDTSTLEVFMTLCSGAALLVVEREAIMPVEPLIETLRIGGVTHAILPPAVLSMLPPDIKLPVLEMLAVGGDVCTGEAARQWSVGRQLFNAYGPTEVTVCVTHETITPTYPGTPAIGRPLANVRAYIFDEHMQLLPQGVVGEIYLGGVQVGRGYLNRADLTAERFVHDPFGKEHNARLYRTGDLARWRPNGVLEYLGRNDQQIKIRGFRIELGEIQSYLMQQPDVLEVIAIAREIRGDKQLLAYVVSNGQPSVDMSMRLRDQLRKTLPAYMVPAAVIVLKQFPLTSNGKIDRSALPLPEFDSSDSLPPDTDFGKAIAEAWKDVLELKTVPGRSANFFALGGHSLQAVRMLSLIKHRLGFEIALRNLFITNTLQEFIDAVVLNTSAAKFSAVHFGGAREKQVIFCIHPVGGHITGYRTLALSMMKYFSVYGLQAGEILTHEEDLNSLNDLAAAHCKAIVAVQSHGPYRLLGWSSGGALAVAIASMMEAQGYIVDYVGLIDPRSVERSYQNNQASLALSLKTTLAALRTSVFEINIEKQMRLHQINLEQLFLSSNLENAKMLFSQFLGVNISKDMASSILDQVLLTQKHIKLLSFISPSPVNALVHVIWAKETLDNIERNKCGVHVNPPDLVIEEQIATDHYRIMQHPFTERVADAICRVIIAKAK